MSCWKRSGNAALEGKLHAPVFSPLVIRDLQHLSSPRSIFQAVGVAVGVVSSSHSHDCKCVETPCGNDFTNLSQMSADSEGVI